MTRSNPSSKLLILGFSILVGLFSLGFFIYKGLKTFSDKDRIVTVKGLAEMEMKATSATIYLSFNLSGDNISELIARADQKTSQVLAFLKKNGINEKDVTINNKSVNDRETEYEYQWIDGKQVKVKIDRYSVSQTMSIVLSDVEEAEDKASQLDLDLVMNHLTCYIYTSYTFPELNSIKPELIAESTKNARVAGEQFANDSKAKLGKIKTASQGQISIVGNYYYYDDGDGQTTAPYIQKARVVSTIVFFLE